MVAYGTMTTWLVNLSSEDVFASRQAFSLCVFAFNCHLNVIPIAERLVRPTRERMRKVSARVNIFQCAFYIVIGVTGLLARSCGCMITAVLTQAHACA